MRTSFKQLKIGTVFPKFKCLQWIRQSPYLSYHLVIIPAKSAILTLQQCQASSGQSQKSYTLKLSYVINETLNTQNHQKLENQQIFNNGDQSFPKNLMQLINTPLFIFLFIFSSSIRIPKIKLLKSAFKQLLDQLDLPCKWEKSNSYYSVHISVRGQQKNPCICHRDMIDIEELGQKYQNNQLQTENRKNNLQFLLNQIKEIKSKNAYKLCEDYFSTKLLPQLLEKHQSQIQQQYQHILDVIEQNYQDMSSTHRIKTSEISQNYIHSLTEVMNPLGRTSNSSQNQRVRRTCSIIQVPNALISIQKSDYSLKALKLSIRNRLVKQNNKNMDKSSAITINSDINRCEVDEEQKKVVHDLIYDLFTSEYEEIGRQLRQKNKQTSLSIQVQIYRKVVQKMKSYIQIDYKCLDLIQIIFKHILETPNSQKSTQKEQMVMNLNEIMEQLQTDPQQASLSSPSIQVKCSQNNDLVMGLCQHIQYLQNLLSLHKVHHNSLKLDTQKSIKPNLAKIQTQSPKILAQKTNTIQVVQSNPEKEIIKRQKYIQNKIEQIKRQQKMKINKIETLKSQRNIDKNNSTKQLILTERNTRKLILSNNDQIENKEMQNIGSKSNRFDDKNKNKNMGRVKGWNSSTSSNNKSIKNHKSSSKEL